MYEFTSSRGQSISAVWLVLFASHWNCMISIQAEIYRLVVRNQ